MLDAIKRVKDVDKTRIFCDVAYVLVLSDLLLAVIASVNYISTLIGW